MKCIKHRNQAHDPTCPQCRRERQQINDTTMDATAITLASIAGAEAMGSIVADIASSADFSGGGGDFSGGGASGSW